MNLINGNTFFLEKFSGFQRSGASFVRKINVRPSGKTLFKIPLAFAVAQKNQLVRRLFGLNSIGT